MNAALCRHVMPSGARCESPALRGQLFCYFHSRQRNLARHNRTPAPPRIPIVEDRSSLQLALNEVLGALLSSRIDARRASIYLRGLQLAARNLPEAVALANRFAVQSICTGEEGEPLAVDGKDTRQSSAEPAAGQSPLDEYELLPEKAEAPLQSSEK